MPRRRVGILGFGHLGQFLAAQIESSQTHELAFVWNRTVEKLKGKVPEDLILKDPADFASRHPDIVVEVCHPSVTKEYGSTILEVCDYMVGSPTVFCDEDVESRLRLAALNHAVYVPSGAFWGGEDIQKMADSGTLKSLKVTMRKHPKSLKLEGRLKDLNSCVTDTPVIIYEGAVREVCPLAPQNTNTMAAAAIAGHSLGFDGVKGCLVSDPAFVEAGDLQLWEEAFPHLLDTGGAVFDVEVFNINTIAHKPQLTGCHVVEIEVEGFPKPDGSFFSVHTVRKNPANVGEVTGTATYMAYFSSLKRAEGKSSGINLC